MAINFCHILKDQITVFHFFFNTFEHWGQITKNLTKVGRKIGFGGWTVFSESSFFSFLPVNLQY